MEVKTLDIDFDLFSLKVREDFSMVIMPNEMIRIPKEREESDRDYSNTAEKGYTISSRAKRKIRSAALKLYCDATREQQLNLRFVTFTFPKLPNFLANASAKDQDQYLHTIFKKFIDNERKTHNVGIDGEAVKLEKYLWVNERQDGSRLENTANARQVIHYHCLLRYTANVNYWFANVRWLNLLRRNGFDIFNSEFEKPQYNEYRNYIARLLQELDYDTLFKIKDKLKIKVYTPSGIEYQSIFLQPVDFDEEPIEDVVKLSKYLSAYLAKKDDIQDEFFSQQNEDLTKIYARRWGASQGLVTQADTINEAFYNHFPDEVENPTPYTVVDRQTGEIYNSPKSITTLNKQKLLNFYRLDEQTFFTDFEVKIGEVTHTLYYFPPNFELWKQIPEIRDFFKSAFNFNI